MQSLTSLQAVISDYIYISCVRLALVFIVLFSVFVSGAADDTCDAQQEFNSPTGTLTSPNYPDDYPNYYDCQWLITIPEVNEKIRIRVKELDIEEAKNCKYDSLEVGRGEAGTAIDTIIHIHVAYTVCH